MLFGVITAGLQLLAWQANRAAADNTEQLVRVQNIQSTLYRADALATNAFLIGGLEPPAQRQAYDDAIDQVSRSITDAAEAQSADRAVLADLNTIVNRYSTSVELARANNRQGFPVGAEYLLTAGGQLRAEAGPIITALVDANAQRSEDEMGAQQPFLLLLPGLAAFALLFWVNRQLAARFRRRFNIGIVAAAAAVAVLTLVAIVVSQGQRSANQDLLDGSYKDAVDAASARTAGNDAKANESLRLIKRGSGQVYEDAWAAADGKVRNTTSADAAWDRYAAVHQQIVTLDTNGRWDDAVALATTSGARGSTAAFEAFDEQSRETVASSGTHHHRRAPRGQQRDPGPGCGDAAGRPRRRRGRRLGRRPAPQGVRMKRLLVLAVAAAVVLAGCGYDETRVPKAAATSAPSSTAPAPAPTCDAGTALRSYAPASTLPGPGDLPSGSTMAKIRKRGRLIAGVSADTYLLGSRNPLSGKIEGFDIDFVRQLADAILGSPDRYQLRVITAADRLPRAPEGRGRRRRPQHDDQLHPLGEHRLLRGVLRVRAEDHGPPGLRHHRPEHSRRPQGLRPHGHVQPRQPAPAGAEGRCGGGAQPHVLPAQVPAGRRGRDHR